MMKRKNTDVRENPKYEKHDKGQGSPYFGDTKLVPRIQQYLASHKSKQQVHISTMSDDLQARYNEYGRKKKNAFRKSVEKAYEYILSQQKGTSATSNTLTPDKKHIEKRRKTDQESSDGSQSDSSASFSDDNTEYKVYEPRNTMNSFMTDLYKKTPNSSRNNTPANSRPGTPTKNLSRGTSPVAKEKKGTPVTFTIDRTGDPSLKTATGKDVSQSRFIGLSECKSRGAAEGSPHKNKALVVIQEDSELTPSSPTETNLRVDAEAAEIKSVPEESDSQPSANELLATKSTKPAAKKSVSSAETEKTPNAKVKKKKLAKEAKNKTPDAVQSVVKFSDVGGIDAVLRDVCKLLVHMKHPEVYHQLGITPPRGVLLHGPPGCGKTLLAHAIAGELELPFIKIAATEIVSGVSGESEEKVRDIFEKATASAPCILFLDEIDAITQKRENASKDMERRIVSQLLTCMDDLNIATTAHVLVIGATNRADSLDPALRRAGRFDREISLGIPDEHARKRILEVLCRGLRLVEDFDFLQLSRKTPGFVGADLMSLAREAAITAVNRVFSDIQREHLYKSPMVSEEIGSTTDCSTNKTNIGNTGHIDVDREVKKASSTDSILVQSIITSKSDVDSNSKMKLEIGNTCDSTVAYTDKSSTFLEENEGMEIMESTPETKDTAAEGNKVINCSIEETSSTTLHEIHQIDSDQALSQEISNPLIGVSQEMSLIVEQQRQLVSEKEANTTSELNSVLSWLKDQPPLTDEQLASLYITHEDFEEALKIVQPSAKREGFATIPGVTWNDIGALQDVREELQMAILAPVRHPEQFLALGLTSPPGILLAGPPGCGKTLLAKAVANESGINFISVKGPELLNMYVGESERAVRQVFQRARNSSPCVIFFDELDALCPRRSDSGEGGASVRVVNQLLTEMDGLEARKQVFIMGATNRPDIIDPAILRPGRLDKLLYVGLPTAEDRYDILLTVTKKGTKPSLSDDVNLKLIANDERCQGFTGADIAALVREASVSALRAFMTSGSTTHSAIVKTEHFDIAFNKVKPSVSKKDQTIYDNLRNRLNR